MKSRRRLEQGKDETGGEDNRPIQSRGFNKSGMEFHVVELEVEEKMAARQIHSSNSQYKWSGCLKYLQWAYDLLQLGM